MNPILCLDIETTGLDCRSCGLVEAAAVAIQDGEITAEWSSLAWPGLEYVKSADHWRVLTEVSGISPALLLDAPSLEDTARSLCAWAMQELCELPLPVTSYNVNFDRPFVKAHLPHAHARMDWRPCLMLKAQKHLGLSRWPSLARACELLGIGRTGEHRALDDARSAARLAIALEVT